MTRWILPCLSLLFLSFSQIGWQSPPPTGEPDRVQVLVVGTHYLPADIMRNVRQREIQTLVTHLAQYQPDQVMVHVPHQSVGEQQLNEKYQRFLEGLHPLNRSVEEQLAFRLAGFLEHESLFGVDDQQPMDLATAVQEQLNDCEKKQVYEFLQQGRGIETAKQSHSLQSSVKEYFSYLNRAENLQYEHSTLIRGLGLLRHHGQYTGADILADWYAYHLRIYANLNEIASASKGEKVIVFMPSSYVSIMKELITADPQLQWVEASTYLNVQ